MRSASGKLVIRGIVAFLLLRRHGLREHRQAILHAERAMPAACPKSCTSCASPLLHTLDLAQTLSWSQYATMRRRYAVQVCLLLSLKDQALSAGITHSNSYILRFQAIHVWSIAYL